MIVQRLQIVVKTQRARVHFTLILHRVRLSFASIFMQLHRQAIIKVQLKRVSRSLRLLTMSSGNCMRQLSLFRMLIDGIFSENVRIIN